MKSMEVLVRQVFDKNEVFGVISCFIQLVRKADEVSVALCYQMRYGWKWIAYWDWTGCFDFTSLQLEAFPIAVRMVLLIGKPQ